MSQDQYTTIEAVEKEFNDVYLLEDTGIVRLVIASVLANRMGISQRPVWLLVIGASAGGKSAVLDSLSDIAEWIVKVDTLTTNTFASGLQVKGEKSASLLDKANGGILVFKDFTTLTSMNQDGLIEIMGQLRAIYDGAFKKETGNNAQVDWAGSVGIIAAGTHAVQNKMRQFSAQGERFINYQILQPDNKEMTRRAVDNHSTIKAKEQHLREVVAEYANYIMHSEVPNMAEIDDETKDELVIMSDFSTLARSPVDLEKTSKGQSVKFVPDREMGARMATQLIGLVETFKVMEGGLLSDISKQVIIRIAMDSIPLDRRMVLRLLTRHGEATTKGLAQALHYPTDTVHSWCQQLDARKLIERQNYSGTSDWWKIRDEYRQVMSRYDNIEMEDTPLDTNTVTETTTEGDTPMVDSIDKALLDEYRQSQSEDTADDLFNSF